MNYVLNCKIPIEMVTVRYGKPSGIDVISVIKDEITRKRETNFDLGEFRKRKYSGRFLCDS